jgi:hypothetical protein
VRDFLNLAGPEAVVRGLADAGMSEGAGYVLRDLNLDGTPDLAIAIGNVYVFYSSGTSYASFYQFLGADSVIDELRIVSATDITLDGTPDIVASLLSCGRACIDVFVYQWEGGTFRNLTGGEPGNEASIVGWTHEGPPELTVTDADGDGTSELILRGGIPTNADYQYGPWREATRVYRWDGSLFVPDPVVLSQAEYRFQAVQDADRAALRGDYDAARELYLQVIHDGELLPWSRDLSRQFAERYISGFRGAPTPTDLPPDSTERAQLRAYARYRLVVMYSLEGVAEEARAAYLELQEESPTTSPGYPYADLASVFWDEFETSSDVRTACGRAIDYASANPSILEPLGSDYHGWQDHRYTAGDICPFG